MMHVPPGWVHFVVNLEACVKMYWGFYAADNLTRYALAWQLLGHKVVSPPDYMACPAFLQSTIKATVQSDNCNVTDN